MTMKIRPNSCYQVDKTSTEPVVKGRVSGGYAGRARRAARGFFFGNGRVMSDARMEFDPCEPQEEHGSPARALLGVVAPHKNTGEQVETLYGGKLKESGPSLKHPITRKSM